MSFDSDISSDLREFNKLYEQINTLKQKIEHQESEFETILRLLHDGMIETAMEVCEENMSYMIKLRLSAVRR